MKSYRIYVIAASITLLALSGAARAQNDDNDGCSNSTLKGDYAFTLSGQILGPNGTSTLVNGVAITNFDGKGGLTQVDFVVTNPPAPAGGEPIPGLRVLSRCYASLPPFLEVRHSYCSIFVPNPAYR